MAGARVNPRMAFAGIVLAISCANYVAALALARRPSDTVGPSWPRGRVRLLRSIHCCVSAASYAKAVVDGWSSVLAQRSVRTPLALVCVSRNLEANVTAVQLRAGADFGPLLC